jgi:Rrf2 family protein
VATIFTLSEAVSIAIHSMVLISNSKDTINVLAIAERTNASKHHVAKIMQRLVKDGFLVSNRGPSGGFGLKRSPTDITLLEIFESIEGKIEVNECMHANPICPFEHCIFENFGKKVSTDFRDYLLSKTVANYIKAEA